MESFAFSYLFLSNHSPRQQTSQFISYVCLFSAIPFLISFVCPIVCSFDYVNTTVDLKKLKEWELTSQYVFILLI